MNTDKKIKHLELIQGVINRMAGNMFLFKGWGITLVAATLALLASKDVEPGLILITLIPVIAFWILDGYFLSQERGYRDLYEEVAKKTDSEEINFSLNNKSFITGKNTWYQSFSSPTLKIFYGMAIAMILIVFLWRYSVYNNETNFQHNQTYFKSHYRNQLHDQMFRSWGRIYIR